MDIAEEVVRQLPRPSAWTGTARTLAIDNARVQPLHALHQRDAQGAAPGQGTGATILIGGKAPIVEGALLSWVIVPFMKMEPPYDDLKDLIEKIWDLWDENGKIRERLGEFIQRVGLRQLPRSRSAWSRCRR